MDNWEAANRLENKAIRVNADGKGRPPEGYGLCSSCNQFEWTLTIYGSETVGCSCGKQWWEKKRLRKNDPISSCSSYYRRGELSLKEMYDMATLIDVKKTPIGFNGEQTEIVITAPEPDKRGGE